MLLPRGFLKPSFDALGALALVPWTCPPGVLPPPLSLPEQFDPNLLTQAPDLAPGAHLHDL